MCVFLDFKWYSLSVPIFYAHTNCCIMYAYLWLKIFYYNLVILLYYKLYTLLNLHLVYIIHSFYKLSVGNENLSYYVQ